MDDDTVEWEPDDRIETTPIADSFATLKRLAGQLVVELEPISLPVSTQRLVAAIDRLVKE